MVVDADQHLGECFFDIIQVVEGHPGLIQLTFHVDPGGQLLHHFPDGIGRGLVQAAGCGFGHIGDHHQARFLGLRPWAGVSEFGFFRGFPQIVLFILGLVEKVPNQSVPVMLGDDIHDGLA